MLVFCEAQARLEKMQGHVLALTARLQQARLAPLTLQLIGLILQRLPVAIRYSWFNRLLGCLLAPQLTS